MKRTPLLAFEVDPAVISGSRVEDVLRRIRAAEAGMEGEPTPGTPSHPESDTDAE
jgi:hypothetical protein